MKALVFLSAIVFLLTTQLKSQKQDTIPHFKKNEIGMNITTPLVYILTSGNSYVPNILELNYRRGFKPSVFGRVNVGFRNSYDKSTNFSSTESYAYSVERIRYKDANSYYKTQNFYHEMMGYASLGAEKRWRVGKVLTPVLAVDVYGGKIMGEIKTIEQTISDSTFTSSTPTKLLNSYNVNYDRGNEIYHQKLNAWALGTNISIGMLINFSSRFYVSAQLMNDFSFVTGKLTETDRTLNSEFSTFQSNFDFKIKGNVNAFYRF